MMFSTNTDVSTVGFTTSVTSSCRSIRRRNPPVSAKIRIGPAANPSARYQAPA